jgi:hypothetical protein
MPTGGRLADAAPTAGAAAVVLAAIATRGAGQKARRHAADAASGSVRRWRDAGIWSTALERRGAEALRPTAHTVAAVLGLAAFSAATVLVLRAAKVLAAAAGDAVLALWATVALRRAVGQLARMTTLLGSEAAVLAAAALGVPATVRTAPLGVLDRQAIANSRPAAAELVLPAAAPVAALATTAAPVAAALTRVMVTARVAAAVVGGPRDAGAVAAELGAGAAPALAALSSGRTVLVGGARQRLRECPPRQG